MKCDFCLKEKPVIYVGYGECACAECRKKYLVKVLGGWAFNEETEPYEHFQKAISQLSLQDRLGKGFC